jgi:hypothetical protein
MEQRAALRSRWNGHRCVAGDRRHAELRAKDELRVRDKHLGVEIFPIALEARIVGDLEEHVNVSARPASCPGISHTAERHVLACGYTGRNVYRDFTLGSQATFTATLLAWRLDDSPFAMASGAWTDGDELAEERALRTADFTLSSARGAHLGSRTRL